MVYFTLGDSIADLEVRTQLLRIPEVLSDLRQARELVPEMDLVAMMGSEDAFKKMPEAFQKKLAQLLQEALFKRWKLQQIHYDVILERRKFPEAKAWRRALKELLHQAPEIHFYIFGPGYDELEFEISKIRFRNPPQVTLHEMIAEDEMLEWFWPALVQNAKLSA